MSSLTRFGKDVYYQTGEVVVIQPHRITEYANLGFVQCNGALVLRNTYPQLFSAMGPLLNDYQYTISTMESGYNQFSIVYANNIFLRGSAANIYVSFDGTNTWIKTLSTTVSTNVINDFTYGNGRYVYVGSGGVVGYSSNANTWISANSNTTLALRCVAYGSNVFVMGGNAGKLASSNDGNVWITRTANNTTSTIFTVKYINNQFIYGGAGGKVAVSSNGIEWIARTTGASVSIFSIAYGNGLYVAVGDSGTVLTSTDTESWTSYHIGETVPINEVVFGKGIFVAAGSSGHISISHNGKNWLRYSNTTSVYQAAVYGNGQFIFVGNNGIYANNKYLNYDGNTHFLLPEANVSYYQVMVKA